MSVDGNVDRTKTMIDNLVQMTDFIFECTKKAKEDRMQFGLTSMSIHVIF